VESPFALSPEQIARFREDGFLAIQGLTTPEEIGRLRTIYDRLFDQKAGYERGLQLDMVSPDDDAAKTPRLSQILNPVELAPELRETLFRKNALAAAKQLLGADAAPWFEHAICKPARHGAATPWHQDDAHRNDQGVAYDQVSFWLPLQEATVENGCLRYIPGSNRGPVLTHRSPNNDPRIMALECAGEFDTSRATFVPLSVGDAVVHDSRTLHGANANQTDTPRRAYIMAFRGALRPAPEFHGYPWNLEKHTAADARARAWNERGGTLGRTARALGGALGRFVGRVQRKAEKLIRGKD
jgi:ectoine hydroxylase-related dioxygenase (phytanoyl-CoA dioxygenase family)